MIDSILHATAALDAPMPADRDLHWTEFQLNDCGWCLHLGYSRDGDPFDDGIVRLVRIVLNTGQRDVSLTAADLDANTYSCCVDQCLTDWQTEVTRIVVEERRISREEFERLLKDLHHGR